MKNKPTKKDLQEFKEFCAKVKSLAVQSKSANPLPSVHLLMCIPIELRCQTCAECEDATVQSFSA